MKRFAKAITTFLAITTMMTTACGREEMRDPSVGKDAYTVSDGTWVTDKAAISWFYNDQAEIVEQPAECSMKAFTEKDFHGQQWVSVSGSKDYNVIFVTSDGKILETVYTMSKSYVKASCKYRDNLTIYAYAPMGDSSLSTITPIWNIANVRKEEP